MSSWTRRWRLVLVGLGAFALAAAIQGAFHVVTPAGARPAPWLGAVPWVIASFAASAAIASLAQTVRRVSGGLARLGAVTLHVLLVLAGALGVFAADPDFPFGPMRESSISLPGDRGTAHLYRGGLFCDRSVWITAPGAAWAYPDPEGMSSTCEGDARLRWDDAQGRVRVVGPDDRSLRSPAHFDGLAEGLDWRPH